jgi:hypothetical protein
MPDTHLLLTPGGHTTEDGTTLALTNPERPDAECGELIIKGFTVRAKGGREGGKQRPVKVAKTKHHDDTTSDTLMRCCVTFWLWNTHVMQAMIYPSFLDYIQVRRMQSCIHGSRLAGTPYS